MEGACGGVGAVVLAGDLAQLLLRFLSLLLCSPGTAFSEKLSTEH